MGGSPDPKRMTHQFAKVLSLGEAERWQDRFLVPALLALGVLHAGVMVLSGDLTLSLLSALCVVLLVTLASSQRLQDSLLGQRFRQQHAVYIVMLWAYGLLVIWLYRSLSMTPALGKDSRAWYVFAILLAAMSWRGLNVLSGLGRRGYERLISQLPLWEQVLVAINEFIAAALLAYVLGGELARLLQPDVFSLRVYPFYSISLMTLLMTYYLIMQVMWLQGANDWLSRSVIWVRFARLFAPLALLVATLVISRHFARLSDPRTANLMDTANLDQAVLALSPIIWMMIFFITLMVLTGSRGLRERFLPDDLLRMLPPRSKHILSTISDMDMLLIWGVLSTSIPLQLFFFDNESVGVIDTLRLQIQQNALIDSSEQALAFLFALPFYLLSVGLLALYAYAISRPTLSAQERDNLVDRLPIGMLIIFIITLYLCAIPFSQVLIEGRLPQIPQELGRILAFDILIPLLLLFAHYFIFIRLPYGRGQSRWREGHESDLLRQLRRTDQLIENLDNRIQQRQSLWSRNQVLRSDPRASIEMLYDFIELNGERDQLNMKRLRIISDRQELADISETPVSITVARLPARIVSLGIPLLLAFKVYEWAVVNNGLREVANNPNIGVIEFFQIILEQTQF